MGYKVAVIGATGNVGREMLSILDERGFPADEVVALASRRSVGQEVSFGDKTLKVKALEGFDFSDTDIALMSDDLSKLAWLVRHSHATLSVIRANTFVALGIKVVFVVLTFTGLASLWGAVAADMGASLVVVANALRLLRR